MIPIPKVELHCHLEGCLSRAVLRELVRELEEGMIQVEFLITSAQPACRSDRQRFQPDLCVKG